MNKNFGRNASIWCTKCGEGDTIVVYFETLIGITIPITDMDGSEDFEDQEDETIDGDRQHETYRCENCEVESDKLDEIATDELWTAYGIWCKKHKVNPETHERVGDDDGEDNE